MEKKKWRSLRIGGAIISALSALFIIYGIFDAIKQSEYRNVGMNTPVIVMAILILIAGVVMFVVGSKNMKSAK